MSGIDLVMNIARGALFAQEQGINVTGHNIANVNTPGYSRQELELLASPLTPVTRLKLGYGVTADSIQQQTDKYVNRNLYAQGSTLSFYETQSSTINYVEGIFNEATENGLNKMISDFWNSWQDLADNPSGIPERTALLQSAETICQKFQTTRSTLMQTREDMNTNLSGAISDINNLTDQIAQANRKIVEAESCGTPANDLRDQRNNLVEQLSQYFDVTYLETASGSYTVMTKSGIALVDGNQSWKLSQEGDNIYWNNIKSDISSRLTGGKVGAWLDLRDNILPQYMANLDELAGTLIHEVNALHYIDGYTLDGSGHQYFFNHLNTVGPVTNGTWTGTSAATSGGDYTGRLQKSYTFTVPANGTVGGAADLTVNWVESATGRTGTITIPAGYAPGTAIHVDGINDPVASSSSTGTAQASASGNYTGTNDRYTFTVQSVNGAGNGTGTVGTDDIIVHWQNLDGSHSGTINLAGAVPGPAYVAGTTMNVDSGLQMAFSSGTLAVGDQFTVETEEGPDVSFSAGTLQQNDTFSLSCADYADASQNIALSSDVQDLPRNIAASTSPDASETGNNTNALAIQALQDNPLEFKKWVYQDRGQTQVSQNQSQTMDEYYSTLVGDVGILANESSQNQDFQQTLVDQLSEMRDSKSGVNLDEELINMMKYQYAYQAASKLVNTADELLQTILAMRP